MQFTGDGVPSYRACFWFANGGSSAHPIACRAVEECAIVWGSMLATLRRASRGSDHSERPAGEAGAGRCALRADSWCMRGTFEPSIPSVLVTTGGTGMDRRTACPRPVALGLASVGRFDCYGALRARGCRSPEVCGDAIIREPDPAGSPRFAQNRTIMSVQRVFVHLDDGAPMYP